MDRFWYRDPSGAEALNNYKWSFVKVATHMIIVFSRVLLYFFPYLDRNMPKWYRSDKEEPHSNSPYKRLKNLKKTKRTPRKSRAAQQDDTLAGPSQDALCLSNGDDSSGSWYSIYNGDASLIARTGVCSGNVYYYPSEESTPEASQHKGHPANVFSSQSSIIEEVDTWIVSYSQRHAGAGDILDAPLGDFGNDLEPRNDGEPLSDVERGKAYAASGDEFCTYDQLHEVYTFQVNDDDTPRLLHFSPSKRRLEAGHTLFSRDSHHVPEQLSTTNQAPKISGKVTAEFNGDVKNPPEGWDQTKLDATRSSLDEISASTRRVIGHSGVVEALHISGHDRRLSCDANPSLGVKLRDLTLRDQSVYEKAAKGAPIGYCKARWHKTEVKARKRFGPNGAFKETFDEDLQTIRMINGSRRPECKSPNTIDLLRPYSGTQLITPDQ
ncbi:hypothetical protein ARMSODRAFT_981406 [Armillaria solidipes]|uniref:Uncharacterized protein n=1 Tax=Armillaria solidipes TaxID=1076256 RepID=A0A2H3B6K2_9AGAR|nr:hypothetical protein ARMSODRAFT_981406 [Armillaria solidipes]